MARKRNDVKISATSGDVVDQPAEPRLHERIVPIPHIDMYSELPFALVETNGDSDAPPVRAHAPKKAKTLTTASQSRAGTKRKSSTKRKTSKTKTPAAKTSKTKKTKTK